MWGRKGLVVLPSCPDEASSLLEERLWLEGSCQAGGAERFLALKLAGSHTDMRLRCFNRAQELHGARALVLVGPARALSTGQAVGCSIPSLFLEFMLSAGISTWRSLASSSAQELITGT